MHHLVFQDATPSRGAHCVSYLCTTLCRDDCNSEDSCVFIGRSITGACVPRDPSILHQVCLPALDVGWTVMKSVFDMPNELLVRTGWAMLGSSWLLNALGKAHVVVCFRAR